MSISGLRGKLNLTRVLETGRSSNDAREYLVLVDVPEKETNQGFICVLRYMTVPNTFGLAHTVMSPRGAAGTDNVERDTKSKHRREQAWGKPVGTLKIQDSGHPRGTPTVYAQR